MKKGWQLVLISSWFQCIWLLSVLGQERFQWLAVSITLATIVLTYRPLAFSMTKLILLLLVGLGIDSVNVASQLLIFDVALLPVWLLALWGIFAWYALFLAKFLTHYPVLLVSVVGGVAGALSYFAGFKIGAVTLGFSLPVTLAILCAEWVLIVLLILRMERPRRRTVSHEP